jgi:hypothetical protein
VATDRARSSTTRPPGLACSPACPPDTPGPLPAPLGTPPPSPLGHGSRPRTRVRCPARGTPMLARVSFAP